MSISEESNIYNGFIVTCDSNNKYKVKKELTIILNNTIENLKESTTDIKNNDDSSNKNIFEEIKKNENIYTAIRRDVNKKSIKIVDIPKVSNIFFIYNLSNVDVYEIYNKIKNYERKNYKIIPLMKIFYGLENLNQNMVSLYSSVKGIYKIEIRKRYNNCKGMDIIYSTKYRIRSRFKITRIYY
ncbi:hypothetical protein SLOPH_522 [Spraguea lophii 42_110]|uniref:Uncharacterized protein n=1 Tax=Spraguea lophii (strain 42_110) TaxID=1358809 RepID=S7XVF4_SPRLO|nr:hypothetical protein SLOPH_522 [Spraguea lophii 42_110]